MKKLLLNLSIVLCTGFTALAQNINIPDATFKAYLVGNTSINTNNDTEISVQEAQAFSGGIAVSYKNISSLTGIEAFVNLTTLYCDYNKLNNIDISNNVNITGLWCGYNQLTNIDLTKNIKLKSLACGGNLLTSLNLSKNINLNTIACFSNNLTFLDLSKMKTFTGKNELFSNPLLNTICISNLKDTVNLIKDQTAKWSSQCAINGDFETSPKQLFYNTVTVEPTINYSRKRNVLSTCTTSVNETNVIDAFYYFIAQENNPKVTVTLSDPNWESKIVLIDTVNFNTLSNSSCMSILGGGTFTFFNLTIGQKYMFRLEIGGTSPLGHARTAVSANTFSVLLNPTVTSIDSEELLNQNKTLQSIYNLQGIEVDKNYNGLVIYRYTDGTTQKVLQ